MHFYFRNPRFTGLAAWRVLGGSCDTPHPPFKLLRQQKAIPLQHAVVTVTSNRRPIPFGQVLAQN